MQKSLDEQLCEKYPKIFADRNSPVTETNMCWGFACGDGWFNILNQLCSNIQHHIDWKIQQRQHAINYNKMVHLCKEGNFDLFEEEMKLVTNLEYKNKRLAEIIAGDFRTVPELIPQVVAEQVKEKFGTLRFYYQGGDEYISGLVSMAESMSGVTCEGCGNPGKRGGSGWVRTECGPCSAAREQERLLREGFEQ